jgi:hypothetical protein
MKMKDFTKLIVASVTGIVFLFVAISNVCALDPSQTGHPDKSNIVIKGRLTTPQGVGIPGLKIGGSGGYSTLPSIPQNCYVGQDLGVTDSNGYYTLVIYVKTDAACRAIFDNITLDRSRLRWRNQKGDLISIVGGWDIKPK